MNKDIMRAMGFGDYVQDVEQGLCPDCKNPIDHQFRNEISRREFQISGLCQQCQDKMFGAD
jgi:hypothetical protein